MFAHGVTAIRSGHGLRLPTGMTCDRPDLTLECQTGTLAVIRVARVVAGPIGQTVEIPDASGDQADQADRDADDEAGDDGDQQDCCSLVKRMPPAVALSSDLDCFEPPAIARRAWVEHQFGVGVSRLVPVRSVPAGHRHRALMMSPSLATALLAVDLTVPFDSPVASAISASDRPP